MKQDLNFSRAGYLETWLLPASSQDSPCAKISSATKFATALIDP